MAYFQRTGSCSVWVRALRQWRSRLYSASVERVPSSSNNLLVAAIAISVDKILASAVTICASATVSALGLTIARSIARKGNRGKIFCRRCAAGGKDVVSDRKLPHRHSAGDVSRSSINRYFPQRLDRKIQLAGAMRHGALGRDIAGSSPRRAA